MMRTDQVTEAARAAARVYHGLRCFDDVPGAHASSWPRHLVEDRWMNSSPSWGGEDPGVCVNEKFPFAYDYADGDNDARRARGSGFHGTHVVGVVVATPTRLSAPAPTPASSSER